MKVREEGETRKREERGPTKAKNWGLGMAVLHELRAKRLQVAYVGSVGVVCRFEGAEKRLHEPLNALSLLLLCPVITVL
jgi:hypothetical protein